MEKSKLKDFLISNGWNSRQAENFVNSPNADLSVTLKKWRESLVGSICTEHPNSGHIIAHMAKAIGKDIPQWKDTSPASMRTLRNYLTTKVTANSAKVYLAYIKATLNLNGDKALTTGGQLTSATKTKQTPVQNVALTEEELERIHRYKPRSQTEADIKREFMIEAYCGARNSDVQDFTEGNIHDKWLVYVSKKTKTKTSVPVHRNLIDYIRQPKGREHSRKVIVQTIQRICRNVGISQVLELFSKGKIQCKPKYEYVGSHTARRSFASQLALRGVPLPVISGFMGHSSPEMTQRYICIQPESISPDVQAFFQ